MLEITNLATRYDSLMVLHDISFALADGAKLGIFGHNGAGKTTLLRSIIGAQKKSSGAIRQRKRDVVQDHQ